MQFCRELLGGLRGYAWRGWNLLFAELGGVVCEEVDDDVASGGFEEHTHFIDVSKLALRI